MPWIIWDMPLGKIVINWYLKMWRRSGSGQYYSESGPIVSGWFTVPMRPVFTPAESIPVPDGISGIPTSLTAPGIKPAWLSASFECPFCAWFFCCTFCQQKSDTSLYALHSRLLYLTGKSQKVHHWHMELNSISFNSLLLPQSKDGTILISDFAEL